MAHTYQWMVRHSLTRLVVFFIWSIWNSSLRPFDLFGALTSTVTFSKVANFCCLPLMVIYYCTCSVTMWVAIDTTCIPISRVTLLMHTCALAPASTLFLSSSLLDISDSSSTIISWKGRRGGRKATLTGVAIVTVEIWKEFQQPIHTENE